MRRQPAYRHAAPNAALAGRAVHGACSLVAAAAVLLSAPWAAGQSPQSPSPAAAETESEAAGEEPSPAGPDTIIWIDDNGAPRPVIGVSYDEFLKAWRKLKGLDQTQATATYTLESITATGNQKNGHFELDVQFEIKLHTDQPVEAPLGFGSAILRKQPAGLEKGDLFGYSEEGECHQATLTGGGKRTITLPLMIPIVTTGQRNELALTLPRASVSLTKLTVRGEATEQIASVPAQITRKSRGGDTVLTMHGAVGRTRVQWSSPNQTQAATSAVVLSAVGEISVDVDSGGARSTARLTVESFGGAFDEFRVRVPPGAKRLPSSTAPLGPIRSIQPVPGSNDRLYIVSLREKTVGKVTVEFKTEQAIGLGDENVLDLAGFDIPGAVRQRGDIAITVDEESQLRWIGLQGARRIAVEDLPASLQAAGVTGAARYFRQNYALPVQVIARATRIEATPSYQLKVTDDQALLAVEVRYQITGAPVPEFSYDLGDWTILTPDPIEVVGPVETIEQNLPSQSDDGLLNIPLRQPQAGSVTVRFRMRRDLAPGEESLNLALPSPIQPRLDTLGRAELTVQIDPGSRLEFSPEMLGQFRALPTLPEDVTADDPIGLQTFRFRSEIALLSSDPLRFSAVKSPRPAERRVSSSAVAAIQADNTHIEQTFKYELLHQPQQRLVMLAPEELRNNESLRLEIVSPSTDDSSNQGELSRPLSWEDNPATGGIEIDLPRPRMGPLTVRANYDLPHGTPELDYASGLKLSLLAPLGVEQLTHDLLVVQRGAKAANLQPLEDAWQWAAEPGALPVRRLIATTPETQVTLRRSKEPEQASVEAVVSRVWRQTWRRGDIVQQRASWRFASGPQMVTIMLPEGVAAAEVEARLDGKPTPLLTGELNQVRVRVDPLAGAGERTVEVRYLQQLGRGAPLGISVQPATLVGDDTLAWTYWQFVLPKSRWLASHPSGYHSAWKVTWQNGCFRRVQDESTARLESWANAATGGVRPTDSERVYLFSALRAPKSPVTLTTVNRNLAVLVSSAGVLALGLLVVYAPGRWRSASLWGAVTVTMLLVAWFPGEALLAAQAGLLGGVALAVAWLLSLTLSPRWRSGIDVSGDSTDIRHMPSHTDTSLRLDSHGVSTNAPTASMETSDPIR